MYKVVAIGYVLAVTVGIETALACSCIAPPPPKEALAQTDAVFAAEVVAVEARGTEEEIAVGAGTMHVTMRVLRRFKGDVGEEVVVLTASNSAACGYHFYEGKPYIVYASRHEGAWHTGLCTRTARLADAEEDLRAFDAEDLIGMDDGTYPEEDGSDVAGSSGGLCGGPPGAAVQVVVFVLAGVLAGRLRRRRGEV